jgi:hypothetical protein
VLFLFLRPRTDRLLTDVHFPSLGLLKDSVLNGPAGFVPDLDAADHPIFFLTTIVVNHGMTTVVVSENAP